MSKAKPRTTTKPARADKVQAAVDPIYAAIDAHRKAEAAFAYINRVLDNAETKARKKHGLRPWRLIAWRNYSHIAHSEIEKARDEFLALPAIDPKKIEKEYRDAKARERAKIAAGLKWDRRVGLAALRKRFERAEAEEEQAALRMARMIPRTISGALALLNYTHTEALQGERSWHKPAIDSVARALVEMARKYEWGISRKAVLALARARGRKAAADHICR